MKDLELQLDTTATAELDAQSPLDLALDLGTVEDSEPLTLALESGSFPAATSSATSNPSAQPSVTSRGAFPAGAGLALDDSGAQKTVAAKRQAEERPSAFAKAAPAKPSVTSAQSPAKEPAGDEVKFLSQTTCDDEGSALKPLIVMLIFGLIGAACFAGISAVYFSIGRRAGILAIAFFAAVGARMATDDLRSPRTRWHAAFLAGGSAFAGKALLALLLFQLYPNFSAEDWMNFAEPGKSNALYFEQSIENALDSSGKDTRSGQEKLDERFAKSWNGEGSETGDDEEYEDSDEESDEDYGEALTFAQVYPKLFDVFDFPLVLVCMFLAYRMARQSD